MNTLGTALYYPNFHMDPEWGKAALLYWDCLARIVPNEAQRAVDEHNPFSRDLVSAGALTSIDTADYIDEAACRFDDYLIPLFLNDPAISFDAEHVTDLLASLAPIHRRKLSERLENDLREMGNDNEEGGFLKVLPSLGAPYMLCLGTVLSERIGIPLITDTPKFEQLGEYMTFGAPSADMEDPVKKALFRLGLPMPSSQNLETVALEEILKFRDARRPERLRLRDALDAVMKEAAEIDDPNRLELYWDAKRRKTDAAVEDFKRCLRAINLSDLASLFKVSVPTGISTTITSASNILGPDAAIALTTIAFSVDVGGVLGNRQYRKQSADQKNPWLYAIQVEKEFGRGNR